MFDDATTSKLVAAASTGDQASWDLLVDGFAGLVWSVVRSHGLYGADAADVSQTVWLRCVEHLDRIRQPERLGAWLATTARHECFRTLRRQGRSVVMAEVPEGDLDAGPSVDVELLRNEDRATFLGLLEELPGSCQQLLRLLLVDPPLSYDEISEVIGRSKGSIGPTRRRCLERMGRLLEQGRIRGRPPGSHPGKEAT